MRLAAVSVDLDEIHHYFAIHGLAGAGASANLHAGYDVALPRLADFAASHSIPLTLFAVGADLDRAANAAALASFASRGHAIENHSQSHRYDLTRLSRDEMLRDVRDGAASIERATGRAPAGFRAPGYTVTDVLFDVLEELGVTYDSSVFPCPPYYFAKAAVLAGLGLRGRRSQSILDTPRVLTAPRRPYRPGKPWHRPGDRRFKELPIQVTPWLGLPLIGTSVELAGPRLARALARACSDEPLVNLELHLIDFLDASDGLESLTGHQPELRIPLERRMTALDGVVDVLKRAGASFLTLPDAAVRL